MALDIYSTRTADEILEDMLDNVNDALDKREGSIVHDMLAPASLELEMLGFELDAILELSFVDSSEGDFLTRKCAELGVDRKQGDYARGEATFVGAEGSVIEAGSLVYTSGELAFATDYEAEIDETGEITIDITAVEMGADGNVGASEINEADATIDGVDSVSNLLALEGGVEEESDDSLKERYYLKVRSPVTSGNTYHYQSLATEVVGVGSASVTPLHAGPGTVKVVIANEKGGAVASETVIAVQAHINENGIIGADVLVVGVSELAVNISAILTLEDGFTLEDVQTAIKDSIANYLESASADKLVRYTQIGNAIIDADGVLDYADLTVNEATSNIALNDETVATVGEMELSV